MNWAINREISDQMYWKCCEIMNDPFQNMTKALKKLINWTISPSSDDKIERIEYIYLLSVEMSKWAKKNQFHST